MDEVVGGVVERGRDRAVRRKEWGVLTLQKIAMGNQLARRLKAAKADLSG